MEEYIEKKSKEKKKTDAHFVTQNKNNGRQYLGDNRAETIVQRKAIKLFYN
jgi:hypothetical protein